MTLGREEDVPDLKPFVLIGNIRTPFLDGSQTSGLFKAEFAVDNPPRGNKTARDSRSCCRRRLADSKSQRQRSQARGFLKKLGIVPTRDRKIVSGGTSLSRWMDSYACSLR